MKLWIVKSFVIFLPIIYNNAFFFLCEISYSDMSVVLISYFIACRWVFLSLLHWNLATRIYISEPGCLLILVSGLTSLWCQAILWIDTVSLLPGPLWIMETQTDTETSHWRWLPTHCECFSSRFQCIKTVFKPCADNGNFVLIVLLCCLRWILCRFNPSLTR